MLLENYLKKEKKLKYDHTDLQNCSCTKGHIAILQSCVCVLMILIKYFKVRINLSCHLNFVTLMDVLLYKPMILIPIMCLI